MVTRSMPRGKRPFAIKQLLTATVLAVVLTPAMSAQSLDEFERVLVPVSVSLVPGAYGTIWSTELWYRNSSGHPVAIFPVAVGDFVPAVGRTAFLPIASRPAGEPGQILYLTRDGASQVQFDLRLYNRADPRGWGTQVPVVRESEFRHEINLLNVPTNVDFRSALRVYSMEFADPFGSDPVRVDIYSFDEHLLAHAELDLRGVPRYAAVLSLADAFPEIRAETRVRVHIESASEAGKIWAFVSVVSNATQDVELVTPD